MSVLLIDSVLYDERSDQPATLFCAFYVGIRINKLYEYFFFFFLRSYTIQDT